MASSTAADLNTYQTTIRRLFNQGENRELLGDGSSFMFDASAQPLYVQSRECLAEWRDFAGENVWSVFAASDVPPSQYMEGYVQRAGVCLIESELTRGLWVRSSQGRLFSEEEALACIDAYPSESQLLGWKPILPIPSVVFYEDVLCRERWNQFTGGVFERSPRLLRAFEHQIERTSECLCRWASLVLGGRQPEVRFIRFSEIWEPLREGVRDWLQDLRECAPEEAIADQIDFNLPSVLYTYIGPRLGDIIGIGSANILLCRQLSHLRNNPGWIRSPSAFVRFFDGSVKEYCRRVPTPMVGYMDMLGGTSRMAHIHTPLQAKYSYGRRGFAGSLREAAARPFPLAENPIVHRGLLLDFLPEIRTLVQEAFHLNESCPPQRDHGRAQCREALRVVLHQMLSLYEEVMEGIFHA